jgi:hypothetical protein
LKKESILTGAQKLQTEIIPGSREVNMSTFLFVMLGVITGSVIAGVFLINSRLVSIEKQLYNIIRILKSK